MSTWASESGHYYDRDGNPAYEVPNKSKGGMRPTRISDAVKHGYFPSFTTVSKVMSKEALTRWLQEQVAGAAYDNQRIDGEQRADYIARIIGLSQEYSEKRRDSGSEIHGALECYFRGQSISSEYREHVLATAASVAESTGTAFTDWSAEKSATSIVHGFGVKTDLICNGWTIDFKTKEFDEYTKLSTYDEHAMQVQANSVAHDKWYNRGAIVYVSASVPGLVQFIEIERPALERGWRMFRACLDLWREKTGYDPRMGVQ